MDTRNCTKLDIDGTPLADQSATDHVFVLDGKSGLMWLNGDIGELRWKDAGKACAEYRGAGVDDWRLPTDNELFAHADRTRFNPAIDTDLYPNTKSRWYWTSTTDASSPGVCAWYVDFYYGGAKYSYQYNAAFVRPVRVARASQ
jgi:hypothetical protein